MRQTKLSKAIIDILQSHPSPISAPEILSQLSAKHALSPNKTSLYRQLEKLVAESMVDALLLTNGVTHYELSDHHHHHFVCNTCDVIQCLGDSEMEEKIHQVEESLSQQGLSITGHQFSFSGQCKTCKQ